MIKREDLRIGNLVFSAENNEYELAGTIKVEKIGPTGINQWADMEIEYEGLSGILLTPEILEKCGFEENMGGWYLEGEIKQNSFSSDDRNFGWCFTLCDVNDDDVHFRLGYSSLLINDAPARHIKYLHQLQNLYHTLTGEELTVNL